MAKATNADSELLTVSFGMALGDDPDLPTESVVEELLHEYEEALMRADRCLRDGCAEGREGMGWVSLPYRDIGDIEEAAEWLKGFDAIVQAGIGGSALGNLMLHGALLPPYWNETPPDRRKGPRFFLADNVDPRDDRMIWKLIDAERTAFIVISKSGSTAETMGNFLFFWDRLKVELGPVKAAQHVLVITDEEKGVLKPFADEIGCRRLVLPSDVGGRFSVLSSVGLLSALALGIDARELLAGAAEMDRKLSRLNSVMENPAWLLAGLSVAHYRLGRNMTVMMPYEDALEKFCEWFAQLWGESLGKDGEGSTPVRALGAIDQHSQIQLYTEGPDDKLFTILTVAEPEEDITIPETEEGALVPLAYLFGQSMNSLRRYEALSTAAAIVKSGKPVVTIEMSRLDERRLGALIQLYEHVTALSGFLLNVNPFNQPGVEQGKNYTYGLMGRPSYSSQALEVTALADRLSEREISL
ncbi:MAG: glucose-6-phosphate isomerase [Synergistaceae bacterium]|nr:glucose-6-phosphate isomerase [Synergistota bacterium]NLM71962.1 glucose-6-phosphate isomerase [Synergistaceae bacterium]